MTTKTTATKKHQQTSVPLFVIENGRIQTLSEQNFTDGVVDFVLHSACTTMFGLCFVSAVDVYVL